MKLEEILNTTVKELADYCDSHNHNCSECPYQPICVFDMWDYTYITLIDSLSANIKELENDQKRVI